MYSIAEKLAALDLRPEDVALWRILEKVASKEQLAAVEELIAENPKEVHRLTETIRLKARAIRTDDTDLMRQIVRHEINNLNHE